MKIGREIKVFVGLAIFITFFYLLNPSYGSLFRLLKILGILLVTLLLILASKKLEPNQRRYAVILAAFFAVLAVCAVEGKFLSSRQIAVILMLLLMAPILPYLLKLIRFESKYDLSAKDLLKIALLSVILVFLALCIFLVTLIADLF